MYSSIVSSQWLNNNLEDKKIVILDASQEISEDNICIVGARYFDIKNEFSDNNSEFPNTFPSVMQFEENCKKLGIKNDSKIVVYDNRGIFYSPRVWWMFKTMGHENIAVLDGGLPDWMANNYETQTIFNKDFKRGNFTSKFESDRIKNYDFVNNNSVTQKSLLVDARSEGRFNGTTPDPREGILSGSIPNSINLHYATVLENNKFKSKAALTQIFSKIYAENKPLVFTCGSGITACILLLASELVSEQKTSVYDGAWTEWATLSQK
ncbi:sulfurtransferase [Vicingus serpentipes]|uniref:Sulfurtransferase n=1 Tax=Vicingus serpentipes TaxID=1926625 RepID=A0A5C6RWQ3_9FLAO|nr:rhodanese-like domain-containing protein [Vicingus serpentipes]TXB66778.1 sulfurtransferase [Vicingus serpentipes]